MILPFVSRARFERAMDKIAALEEKIALMAEANEKLNELAEAEKELRLAAEQRAEQSHESQTKPHRMFGKDLRDRATAWATDRSNQQGTTK